MSAEEFAGWIAGQQPALRVWGEYVTSTISSKVREAVGEKRYTTFFKIPPTPRVKAIGSALAKLAKKGYEDPQSDMTDLVGTRFVVLLRSDIPVVESAIASHTGWTLSRERDPSFEVSEDPNVFDYQSTHYLVRAIEERLIDGVVVPPDTTCEVQIRTLLQHAYAELVHDNVYKTDGAVPVEAKRLIARCMALMETTDEMFCSALEELQQVNTNRETWLRYLSEEYGRLTGRQGINSNDDETNELLDTYRDLLQLANRQRIVEECIPRVLAGKIGGRAAAGGLFAKPVCLIVYWLLANHPGPTIDRWPLEQFRRDFETAMADMAIARV